MAEELEKVEVQEEVKPKRTRKKVEAVEGEVAVEKKTVKRSTKKAETTDNKEVAETESAPVKKAAAKKATKTTKVKAQEFLGTGKRKTSVARVRLTTGSGKIEVNGKEIKDYFLLESLVTIAKQPLVLTELENLVDVKANIYGGGLAGQAGALRHGITKALIEFKEELRPVLKKAGFITRDARKKERKKYGLKKARKAPQFSKR